MAWNIVYGTPRTTLYETAFPSVENPISEGGIWTVGGTDGLDWHDPKTIATPARCVSSAATPGFDDALGIIKSSSYPANAAQWAEGVVYRNGSYIPSSGGHEIELLTRFSISAHDAHGYEFLIGLNSSDSTHGYAAVVKWIGPLSSYAELWNAGFSLSPVPADGDVFRFEIIGNVARCYWNGTKIGPTSNSPNAGFASGGSALDVDLTMDTGSGSQSVWSSGQPGLGYWPNGGGVTLNDFGWRSWKMGNL